MAVITNANEVLRAELLAKLKELVFSNDRRMFEKHHKLDFYKLITDSAHRETTLLKLVFESDKILSNMALDIVKINFPGTLLRKEPKLIQAQGDRVVIYPAKEQVVNMEKFKQRWKITSVKVFSGDAA